MGYEVFISYSSKDRQFAVALKQHLTDLGVSCWIDREGIGAGDDWTKKIAEALRQVSVFVLVYSSNSIDSENVKDELAMAAKRKLAIVPVRLEDIEPCDDFEIRLARYNWMDIFDMQQDRLKEIAESIKARVDGLKPLNMSGEINLQTKMTDGASVGSDNENKYMNALRTVYSDGVVTNEELSNLYFTADLLGITKETAEKLDYIVRQELNINNYSSVLTNIVTNYNTSVNTEPIKPNNEEFKLILDYFRAVITQCSEESLKEWLDSGDYYESDNFSFSTKDGMVDALTQVYFHYCVPVTKNSIVAIFDDIVAEANLSEVSLKAVCAALGVDNSGRKNVLIERLEEEFSTIVDNSFPNSREVYLDNPNCPDELAILINALVNQLSMDQLKDWIEEFNIDSTVRRNSRKEMVDSLCNVYRCYVPNLSHKGRGKFFRVCYSQLDEQQVKNICQEINFDGKGRKKELIEKLVGAVPQATYFYC